MKILFRYTPELSLQGAKIYDGNFDRDNKELKFKILSRTPPKNMAIHVETIGPQQDSVCRALSTILPKLDKDLHGLELRLVAILTYKTDDNLAARLKRVAIKHSHITSNAKTYELEGINNIDHPLPNAPNLTLRKLIMNLKTEEGETFAITITHNWNGSLDLWAKKKHENSPVL